MSILAALQRHPLVSYFALACGITWGRIIVVGGAACFQGLALPPSQLPLVMLATLLGPSVAVVFASRLAELLLAFKQGYRMLAEHTTT